MKLTNPSFVTLENPHPSLVYTLGNIEVLVPSALVVPHTPQMLSKNPESSQKLAEDLL
jgi:hypothetical protein